MTESCLDYLIFNPQERYWNFFQCCLFTILVTAQLRLDSNWKTDLKQWPVSAYILTFIRSNNRIST